jgi:hypothetical protein
MVENWAEWASGHGQLTKIELSDGCKGDTVHLAVGKWCDFHTFGWHLGNVGQVATGILRAFFLWLLSVPWWIPWSLAFATTALLIWLDRQFAEIIPPYHRRGTVLPL